MERGLAIAASIDEILSALASAGQPGGSPAKLRLKLSDLLGEGTIRSVDISAAREMIDVTAFGDTHHHYMATKRINVKIRAYWSADFDVAKMMDEGIDFEHQMGDRIVRGPLIVTSVQVASSLGDLMEVIIDAVAIGEFTTEPLASSRTPDARGIALTGVK